MAGCYGGSAEDRYFEGKLFAYLESQEIPSVCEDCEHATDCECTASACETGALTEPYDPREDE